MSNEEVKEEVEKVPEEVEEVSRKETKEVPEEAEQKQGKFVNVTKLKCNYTTYKNERTKLKMPVTTKCQKCGKAFKDGDELYSAYKKNDKTEQNYLICKNCIK